MNARLAHFENFSNKKKAMANPKHTEETQNQEQGLGGNGEATIKKEELEEGLEEELLN